MWYRHPAVRLQIGILTVALLCGGAILHNRLEAKKRHEQLVARMASTLIAEFDARAAKARITLAHDPNNAQAHRDLATAAGFHRDRATQIHELQEVTRLRPDDYDTKYELATRLALMKRNDEARALLTEVVNSRTKWSGTAKWWLEKVSSSKPDGGSPSSPANS